MIASFLIAAAGLFPHAAELEVAPENDGLAKLVDELVLEAMQAPEAVGLSVAVALGDEMVLAEGYGLAEVEHGVEADAETTFRIGSVTKQFTSAAIMRLYEERELELDEDMRTYLPDYPSQGRVVTLRHLLTHTSGIPSYTGLGEVFWGDVAKEVPHSEMLALWVDLPFEFEPGTRYSYNNSGYYLLGMVVEAVAGKSYADYVQGEFFGPLGLARTLYDSNEEIIANRAQGYRYEGGRIRNDPAMAMGRPGAAGALLSSARELVSWQLALVGGRVVEPASYEEMTLPFMLEDTSETAYGLGLGLEEKADRPCVSHAGGIFGFNSFLAYFPGSELSVAVISNCEQFDAEAVATKIVRAVLEGAPAPAAK